MLTLTYGYKKPEANDKGPVVFPALEDDIQQLNDHDHDGSNSKLLPSTSLVATSQTILAANWVSLGGGNYSQQVTMSPGTLYDTTTLTFRDPTTGEYLYPSVAKVSAAVFSVASNTNGDMLAIYGV